MAISKSRVFLKEYTKLDKLGQGGFASVFKVRHNELGYVRAIRVLNSVIEDEKDTRYQKFLRECKVLLRLGNGNHPNIVHIYQPRLLDNQALVEMDYVDGSDLTHYIKQQNRFVEYTEVERMAEQMSYALAYCHSDIYKYCMDREEDDLEDDPEDGSKVLMNDEIRTQLIDKYKVIHNDIHSGNIMRRENGQFLLLDFGLAIEGNEVVHSSRHTNGAPEYKAPEKWDNELTLSEQSDIYSFGIVWYELLAGRVPFPYDTTVSNTTMAEYQLLVAHKEKTPEAIEPLRKAAFEATHPGQTYERDYPEWMEEAIMRCLEKKPEKRFRNGRELYDFILEHLQPSGEHVVVKEKVVERVVEVPGSAQDAEQVKKQQEQLAEKEAKVKDLETKLSLAKDTNEQLHAQIKQLKMQLEEVSKKSPELPTDGEPILKKHFCPVCGKEIRAGVRFCKYCGFEFKK